MTNTKKKHRLTLFIDPLIVKHARAHAIVEDISLTHLVTLALVEYLPEEIVIKKNQLEMDPDR